MSLTKEKFLENLRSKVSQTPKVEELPLEPVVEKVKKTRKGKKEEMESQREQEQSPPPPPPPLTPPTRFTALPFLHSNNYFF